MLWLDELPLKISAPGGQPVEVGDQGLMWARLSASGQATIYFRKGRAMCRVVAPSVTIATRWAVLLAGLIPQP